MCISLLFLTVTFTDFTVTTKVGGYYHNLEDLGLKANELLKARSLKNRNICGCDKNYSFYNTNEIQRTIFFSINLLNIILYDGLKWNKMHNKENRTGFSKNTP